MAAITTSVDTASKEFRANAAAMRALVAELDMRRAKAAEGGPPRARERHLARGKLLPRERVMALLDPTTRALGPIYLSQLQGAVLGAPLPLGASVLIAWPQIVGMIATAIMLFVIGYVIFQRQEVRA